jgi:transcriptional regulator with XRE-family HTH domain
MSERGLNAFAQRMAELCNDLGLPSERGRVSALARAFNVTSNAAKKWLTGVGMPELEKAVEIADRARASVTWLLQGAGPKHLPGSSNTMAEAIGQAAAALAEDAAAEIASFVRYKLDQSSTTRLTAEEKQQHQAAIDYALKSRKPH